MKKSSEKGKINMKICLGILLLVISVTLCFGQKKSTEAKKDTVVQVQELKTNLQTQINQWQEWLESRPDYKKFMQNVVPLQAQLNLLSSIVDTTLTFKKQ